MFEEKKEPDQTPIRPGWICAVLRQRPDEKLGISLTRPKQSSHLILSKLNSTSRLARSSMQVGNALMQINGTDCAGMDKQQAFDLVVQRSNGPLTIIVRHPDGNPNVVETLLERPPNQPSLGFSVAPNPRNQQLHVTKLKSDLLAHTPIRVDDRVLAINHVPCDPSNVMSLIRDSNDTVILTTEHMDTTSFTDWIGQFLSCEPWMEGSCGTALALD